MEKKLHQSFLEKNKINLFYSNKKLASENVEVIDNGNLDAYSWKWIRGEGGENYY